MLTRKSHVFKEYTSDGDFTGRGNGFYLMTESQND